MKIFSCFDPSFSPLVENHFRPSAEKYFGAGNVILHELPSACSGEYGTPGYRKACRAKVELIRATCASEREHFAWSDADVRIYGDVPADLAKHVCSVGALGTQWDYAGGFGMGFLYVRDPAAVANVMDRVGRYLDTHRGCPEDQIALNTLIRHDRIRANVGALSAQSYWTQTGATGVRWLPGMPVAPPRSMLVHHANWCVGVPNKLACLDAVRDAVAARDAVAPVATTNPSQEI